MNTLYLGDCLYVLRENIPDESVDLIYIDPPFNSKRDYNMFFDDKKIQTQRIAFEDTWTLKNVADSLQELHTLEHENLWALLIVYQKVAPHAFPYLVMMALRLVELHRILKPTGSFYVHCDPTMSHYLKTVCDLVFGVEHFQNEIIWKRTSAHSDSNTCGNAHDIILSYSKTSEFTWNQQHQPYDENYIESHYRLVDEKGRRYRTDNLTAMGLSGGGYTYEWNGVTKLWRLPKDRMQEFHDAGRVRYTKTGTAEYIRYLDEMPGMPLQDIWTDLSPINSQSKERLGYPTQKPKTLLERIIKASSNEGDVVLDAFCGCGTTIDAAEGLHRRWISIDISPIAVSLIKRRLEHTYKKGLSKFEVRGIPADEASALKLWKENPFAFQDWWITEFDAFSSTFGTKGADKGVDGIALYSVDTKGTTLRAAFQVKGGETVQSKDIDALMGAMQKHECALGVFLTAAEPTKPMLQTVAASGYVKVPGFEFPKVQILTLEEYFKGKRPKLPQTNITFKAAQHSGKKVKGQMGLEME
ncbi:MAG: restriction endonuclease [Ignavibacteria bacterium]|nr:restriction endonuclease [Ignavibacteria bacterium]